MVRTPAQQRDRIAVLAHEAPSRALDLARSFKDPWAACQALAWVARFWPHRDFIRIIDESIAAARRQDDPYRAAASTAWPIRALLEREAFPQAEALLAQSLRTCRDIAHPSSHAEATFLLFQAARPFSASLWLPPLSALVCPQGRRMHWRQKRYMRDALAMLGPADLEAMRTAGANDVIIDMASEALKLMDRAVATPRPFFW